jgi:hypothetical protein
VHAQELASISGSVVDAQGAAMAGTVVTIVDVSKNFKREVMTNEKGEFSVPELQPGHYTVHVQKEGFQVTEIHDITLNVSEHRVLRVSMTVGSVTQSVEVNGNIVDINTTDASVSTVVDRQFAENLPLNGRTFQSLLYLTPGITLNTGAGFSGDMATGQFSVNGQRAVSNYWTVDGVSANVGVTPWYTPGGGVSGSLQAFNVMGGTNSMVSVDALQEFRVQTSTYAPEFGRTPGGQISIVTRSGTNQFHGTLFDYFRNTVLDAEDWFASAQGLGKAAEKQNDFGGVVGGPIIKNKTFFFFSYEGLRVRQPQTVYTELVLHTHQSYPVGHLATMYWIGLRPEDLHYNISSPGWAKHAWSCFFAPWNAGATVFVYNYARFDAKKTLDTVARYGVTTLCAPPTVWRMFILEDLRAYDVHLKEVVAAGEPLNPEIIEQVRSAWGLTVRDGFGQTENVLLLGNFPGQKIKPGSVGRPSPGHRVVLLDRDSRESDDGEISLRLDPRPSSLMAGYADDIERNKESISGGHYRTGDVAARDEDGYFTYVGRADDVFKSSDYRLGPFELESALIEHPAVAEAAVVPSPDAIRGAVPKAFIMLVPSLEPSLQTARELLLFSRERLGPHKRIRRIEFCELPKTISGKIRRAQLRKLEHEARPAGARRDGEFWEEDFSDLYRADAG